MHKCISALHMRTNRYMDEYGGMVWERIGDGRGVVWERIRDFERLYTPESYPISMTQLLMMMLIA